ncbi:hypothetical protein [Lysinibacillus sp.]|uniref:hypothetical protein n=1 Tax=Lysinibacillus sp. TaxID=1869345 RepID=UPI0028AE5A9E|nr:hypothetical protein [Lysinibacillus sp.]
MKVPARTGGQSDPKVKVTSRTGSQSDPKVREPARTEGQSDRKVKVTARSHVSTYQLAELIFYLDIYVNTTMVQ